VNIAIVPAGGAGARLDSNIPKQFIDIGGKPLIIHTLLKLNAHTEIDAIIVGCKTDYIDQLWDMAKKWDIGKLKRVIPSGGTRQETVFNCLTALDAGDDDIILIHDAARPLVTDDIIHNNIASACEHNAVTTAYQAPDTIARSEDGFFIDDMPPRSGFFQLQTPQTFTYKTIREAHLNARQNSIKNASDDCGLCMANGISVYITPGASMNFKVTHPEDMELFEQALTQTQRAKTRPPLPSL